MANDLKREEDQAIPFLSETSGLNNASATGFSMGEDFNANDPFVVAEESGDVSINQRDQLINAEALIQGIDRAEAEAGIGQDLPASVPPVQAEYRPSVVPTAPAFGGPLSGVADKESSDLTRDLERLPGAPADYLASLNQAAVKGIVSVLDLGPLAFNASGWLSSKLPGVEGEPYYMGYPSEAIGELTGFGDKSKNMPFATDIIAAGKQTAIDLGLADEDILAGQEFSLDTSMMSEKDAQARLKQDPNSIFLNQAQRQKVAPYQFGIEIAAGGLTGTSLVSGGAINSLKSARNSIPIQQGLQLPEFLKQGRLIPRSRADLARNAQITTSTPNGFVKTAANPASIAAENKWTALSAISGTSAGLASNGDPLAMSAASIVFPSAIGIRGWFKQKGIQQTEILNQMVSTDGQVGMAIDGILKHATDPERVLQVAQEYLASGKQFPVSLGALTGDRGLLSFEKGLDIKNFKFALNELDRDSLEYFGTVLNDIGGQGVEASTQAYFNTRIAATEANLNAQLAEARNLAEHNLNSAGSKYENLETANIEFMRDMDGITGAQSAIEKSLWSEVGDATVNARRVLTKLKQARAEAFSTLTGKDESVKGMDKIISDLEKLASKSPGLSKSLGGVPAGQVDVKELIDMRSAITAKLREMAFEGKTGGFHKKLASDLQAIILDEIMASSTGSAYDEAANFTRNMHEMFDKTFFDAKDDISQIISNKMLVGQERGAQTADQILKVSGAEMGLGPLADKGIIGGTEQVILSSFAKSAVNSDATVRVKDAQKFLDNNAPFLRRFPETRQKIEAALESGQSAELAELVNKESLAALEDTAVALWVAPGLDTNRVIDKIISGRVKAPGDAVESLVTEASQDSTGKALAGLQRAFMDRLIESNAISKVANRNKLYPSLEKVFGKEQTKLIRSVFDDVDKVLDRSSVPITKDQHINSVLLSTIGKVMGANFGKRVAGSPLIMAGVGSKLMQTYLEQLPREAIDALIQEMITNPAAFASYKNTLPKLKNPDEAAGMLNQWLIMSGIQSNLTLRKDQREEERLSSTRI